MARFITQLRHGTTADWELSNVVPAKNELVVEYCSDGIKRFKLGDGHSLFSQLRYIDDDTASKVASLQRQLDTLSFPDYENGEVAAEAVANEVANIRNSTYHGDYLSAGDAVRAIEEEVYDLKGGLHQLINAEAVDGLKYVNNELWLTADGVKVGNSVTITGGTGGGPSVDGYSVILTNNTGSLRFNAASSANTYIQLSFTELRGAESTEVPGYLTVESREYGETDWQLYEGYNEISIQQNIIKSIDVTSLLQLEKKIEIRVSVTGASSGITESLTYEIKLIDAFVETTFSPSNKALFVANNNFNFTYKCYGADIEKHVYFDIDDAYYADEAIGRIHNTQKSKLIDTSDLAHGGHTISVYFRTPEGAESNVEKRMFFYNDGISSDTMIAALPRFSTIKYGELLQIDYSVVTPGRELTSELEITVYTLNGPGNRTIYSQTRQQNIDTTPVLYQVTSYPSSGDVFIEFRSGSTVKTVVVTVEEYQQGQDLQFENSGLIYAFNTSGKTNNDADRERYTYEYTYAGSESTNIITELKDFNWVSNGYNINNSDCLRLSGDARCEIQLPVFTTGYHDGEKRVIIDEGANPSITANGRTIEFDIRLTDVRNYNAEIIKCISDSKVGAGFVVTPQLCYILAANQQIETDDSGFLLNEEIVTAAYIKEDTRLRLAFVIEPRGSVTSSDGSISSQCLSIYVNGQYASSHPYANDASFTALNEHIHIGSNDCTIDLFDVRVYNRGLSSKEVLKNYIASPKMIEDKVSRFNLNNVLDNESCVVYDLAKEKYTCLLVTGELSMIKDSAGQRETSKKESGLILTKPGSNTPEFSLMEKDENDIWLCMNNVQGTTSVTYPVKNYKFYLRRLNGYDPDTHKAISKKVKYELKGPGKSIGESTLCWKCDFMSTDHANTFNANLADTLFSGDDLVAKKENPLVQNTVYGFPCLLFQRETEESPIKFVGAGTLNNDKGNSATFGLECEHDEGNKTTRQKWEFKNSTSDVCLFKTDKLLKVSVAGGLNPYEVYGNLESCYPDEGDLNDEGQIPDYSAIQTLYTWIYQRANFWDAPSDEVRQEKKKIFKEEFTKHFNLEHALVYYLFMEFTALVDNRAKNLFLRSENIDQKLLKSGSGEELESIYSDSDVFDADTGEIDANKIDWQNSEFAVWLTDLYDLDSCFGVENVGKLEVPYYAEWTYQHRGKPMFNGYESRLWLMFEEAFEEEIKTKAQVLTKQKLQYSTLCNYHGLNSTSTVESHCPAIINADMKYKYEDPWTHKSQVKEDANDDATQEVGSKYKYLQRGDRKLQKSSFLQRRYNMLCSKYQCEDFVSTNASLNFRSLVDINGAKIPIKYCQTIYPVARLGDTGDRYLILNKVQENSEHMFDVEFPVDNIGANEKIYICGGSTISNIGDLSIYKPYDINLNNTVNLRSLKLGDDNADYVNTTTQSLTTTFQNCKLLEELNVAGWTGVEEIGLSNNYLLEVVNASRCNAKIEFPNGGVLRDVKLGAPPELKIRNHSKLEHFSCSYENLRRLWIENTPFIDSVGILNTCYSNLTNGIRLVGVSGEVGKDFLENILLVQIKGQYLDQDGQKSDDPEKYPYITGTLTYHDDISADLYNRLKSAYPDLDIVYDSMSANVNFIFEDGTQVTQVVTGANGVAGNAEVEVTATAVIIPHNDQAGTITTVDIPTMESSAEFSYTFAGWTTKDNDPLAIEADALLNVSSNRTLYPAFSATVRSYDVRFWNGSTLIKTSTTRYGEDAEPPETPFKEGYTDEDTYAFQKWHPDPTNIRGELDCYAQYVVSGEYYTLSAGDIEYDTELHDSDGVVAITEFKAREEKVVRIPETLEGLSGNVTEVGGFEDASVEVVVFPETVTKYRADAFRKCTKLEEVSIGKNVSTLENECFGYCTGLKKINYNATEATIASDVQPFNYSGSNAGAVVTIGAEVKSIPQRLFYQTTNWCDYNKRVIDTLNWEEDAVCTVIGKYAFYQTNPRVINFPENLIRIESNAFVGNNLITELEIPATVQVIQSGAFASWRNLQSIRIPSSITSIGDNVFADCGSLRQIVSSNDKFIVRDNCLISVTDGTLLRGTNNAVVPVSGIQNIASNAFSGLSEIVRIDVPSPVREVKANMASNCPNLETVTLPDTIKIINSQAFTNCKKLTNVTIPSSVEEMYSSAFSNTAITEITIPSSITKFGAGMNFKECKNLTTVTFERAVDNSSGMNMFQGCTSLRDIYWPGVESDALSMDLWTYMSVNTSKVTIHYGG